MALDDLPGWLWLVALAFLVLLGARLQRWLSARRRTWTGRRHQRAGAASEREAARWLGERGFRVLETQPSARYDLEVSGRARPVEICADLRVHDGREEWIVEVKTGERGSRVGFRGTRRQLLEYQLAFGAQGVLLVDPGRGVLERVRFPFTSANAVASRRQGAGLGWWLTGIVSLALWAWLASR